MTLPVTTTDLDQVRAVTEVVTPRTVDVQPCPAGALLRSADAARTTIPDALSAAGYTVNRVSTDLLLVSGVIDRAELLDAEIARLVEQRDRLRVEG